MVENVYEIGVGGKLPQGYGYIKFKRDTILIKDAEVYEPEGDYFDLQGKMKFLKEHGYKEVKIAGHSDIDVCHLTLSRRENRKLAVRIFLGVLKDAGDRIRAWTEKQGDLEKQLELLPQI